MLQRYRLASRLYLLGSVAFICAAHAWAVEPLIASKAGARLNSHLLNGGGTDDTRALQAVLDRAADGTPVHLIVDGAALVSGLNVHGNSTIECINGAGFYLKDGSNRSIIRNAHRSRGAVIDARITLRGCFLNGNRAHQGNSSGHMWFKKKESDGTLITGVQFNGVNYLTIENVVFWSPLAFGALISNASYVQIRNVIVDHSGGNDPDMEVGNVDGLHFNGPTHYVTVDGLMLKTGDDGLAFAANDFDKDDMTLTNDFGPYVGQGEIADVAVNNVVLAQTVSGIRFVSSKDRIDRVVINNVTGVIKGTFLLNISHFINRSSFGNIGSIVLSNIDVSRAAAPGRFAAQYAAMLAESSETIRKDSDGVLKDREQIQVFLDDNNEGKFPLISVNARVENLTIRNFTTRDPDRNPILRVGPSGKIEVLTAEMSIRDAELPGLPIELDVGSHIERLNLSIDWKARAVDQGKNPITSYGGTIGQLYWTDTPPMFVEAKLNDEKTVAVTFSQDVKALDFKAGARISVNGRSVPILRTHRDSKRTDVVYYAMQAIAGSNDNVTWSYEAANGNVQNLSGDQLLSVAAKPVQCCMVTGGVGN